MPRPSTSSQQNSSRRRTANNTTTTPMEATEDLEEMTASCVRYVIFKAGTGLPIKKSDLQEYTTKNSVCFNTVLERARVALMEIYGYDLWEMDGKVKCYTVGNLLTHVDLDEDVVVEDEDSVEDADKILIMLILTHVFMCGGAASEKSLFDYLRSFEIEFEQTHPIFGSIKEFFQHLIKARYITTEVETGTQRLNYKWGAKADKEVSKLAILKFVANVCGKKRVESYKTQYVDAMEQVKDNADENQESEEDEEME